jgi:hypothetical protein
LNEGLEKNSFEPVRSLNGAFPAHGTEAGIAYSQSYSVVKFLLETYGQEKLQQMILVLAEGAGYDDALTQVYGFNVDGLELAWRAALGVPMRVIPPTPTALSAANIPTIEPQGAPGNVPTPPAAAETAVPPSTAPSNGSGICNLAVLPLLFIGIILTRRKQTT